MAVTEPVCSSNSVWYDENMERSVTDEVESVKTTMAGKAPTDHTHTPASIGAAAAAHEHTNYALAAHTHDLSGKADLVDGKVPASQLPSYVDDVVEAHIVSGSTAFSAGWLAETEGGTALTPESGKVYIIITAGDYEGKTYRWSGTVYAPIGNDLALGETASTAHRGDHGKIAYDHSQNGDVHVTADQKAAWDSKAAGDHNHDAAYMAKALQMTQDNGDSEVLIYTSDNKNILDVMEGLGRGLHTLYSQAGVEGNPNATESFRILVHKPGTAIMWVLAFGHVGGVYSNFCGGVGSWMGWKTIFDARKTPLWSGAMYMTAGHTVTPTKALNLCANGWLLVWSDYDTSAGVAGDYDFATTVIPKIRPDGSAWSGQNFLCHVPGQLASTSPYGEATYVKGLVVHNDKIVGHVANNQAGRNDVVLRAVYEF